MDRKTMEARIEALEAKLETATGDEAFVLEAQHRACWKQLELLNFNEEEAAQIDQQYAESEGERLKKMPEGIEEM